MRLEHHVALSAVVSGGVYLVTRSWPMTASSLATGVFIDGDHLFDYIREYGWRWNPRQFFRASYERKYKRVILLLHAWEWLPLLLLLAWWSGWNPWIVGLVIGWAQHLAADQLCNTYKTWAYFITWRWRHRFDHKLCFPFKRQ